VTAARSTVAVAGRARRVEPAEPPRRTRGDGAAQDATVLRLLPTRPRRWVVSAVMVVGLFGILGTGVAIQASSIGEQDRYDALKVRVEDALDRQRDLRVAVAQAESPGTVLDAARDLGMIEPGVSVAVPAGPTDPPTPPPAPTTTTVPSQTNQPSTGSAPRTSGGTAE